MKWLAATSDYMAWVTSSLAIERVSGLRYDGGRSPCFNSSGLLICATSVQALTPHIYERREGKQCAVAVAIAMTLTCGAAKAECGGERRAACGGRRAPGSGNDDGEGDEQATAVYSNVRLFSSCDNSNGIQYSMFNFAFFVPGALETARGKKQDRKMTSG